MTRMPRSLIPDPRLYRKGKGKEARLYFMGHILMENRNGLAVDTRVTRRPGRLNARLLFPWLRLLQVFTGSLWARTKDMTAQGLWRICAA